MANKKKILIFNPSPIFPLDAMHLVRVFNQIKGLSKNHEVDFMFTYTKNNLKEDTIANLKPFCPRIINVKTISQTFFYRVLRKLFLAKVFRKAEYPMDYFTHSNIITAKKIASIISKSNTKYDIVITHYWQSAGFLKFLDSNIFKCIDTHYLVQENIELFNIGAYSHIDDGKMKGLLEKELILQNKNFKNAELLIVNSSIQRDIIIQEKQNNSVLYIPNGQDLSYYLDFQSKQTEELNLLFYGSLSNQFNEKALKRLINNIWPELVLQIPCLQLIILGKNPPVWLIDLAANNSKIEVTGFVEDVRPVFGKCFASVIPLESGAGFRGRTVELMAGGVPVIGTHNALDSIGLDNGVNGFMADTDIEIINLVITLANEPKLRQKISMAGKEFVKNKYSLEASFGKLSEYIHNIEQ